MTNKSKDPSKKAPKGDKKAKKAFGGLRKVKVQDIGIYASSSR